MDDANYLALLGRIKDLEARVKNLENRHSLASANGDAGWLLETYPFMMDKSAVARVLSVTRATVYKLIADGVLDVNPVGKIPTRSVIDYIEKGAAHGETC